MPEGYSLPTGDQTTQSAQSNPQSSPAAQPTSQQPAEPQSSAPQSTASQSSAASTATNQPPTTAEIKAAQDQKTMNATITTSLGTIKVELYGDKTPTTVANFVKLANAGFYNGIKFHRVIKGFMIQGGDPLTKDDSMQAQWGTGGPGYKFDDEPFTGSYTRGTLAMANSGPNTNGSQFFIMHQDYPLPNSYVIFGKVTSGLDVVDKIANLPTDPSNDRPLTPPVIEGITIDK
jgi:cyclophilin family peptidyl-prolyl cis-trans isomerase